MYTESSTIDIGKVIPQGRALEAIYAVAYTMLEAQRLHEATAAFRVMVRFAPTDERGWLGLGKCHEEVGQSDIAAQIYGAGSLATSPPSSRCLVARARLDREIGDLAEADELLDEALGLAEASGDSELEEQIRKERRLS
jgi:tetratricopeptide (TPR) repeat protein